MERWHAKLLALCGCFILPFCCTILPHKLSGFVSKKGDAGKRVLGYLMCFGGGIFFGTYLLHMGPEVRLLLKDALLDPYKIDYPLVDLFVGCGFLLVLFAEKFVLRWNKRRTERRVERQRLQSESFRSVKFNGNTDDIPPPEITFQHNSSAEGSTQNYSDYNKTSNGLNANVKIQDMSNENNRRTSNGFIYQIEDKNPEENPVSFSRNSSKRCSIPRAVMTDNQASDNISTPDGVPNNNSLPKTDTHSNNVVIVVKEEEEKNNNKTAHSHHHIQPEHHSHSHNDDDADDGGEGHHHHNTRSIILILALSLHRIFEGMSVGLQQSLQNIWSLFLAVMCHETVIGFSLGLQLVKSKLGVRRLLITSLVCSIIMPIGVATGIIMTETGREDKSIAIANGILQAIAMGTFIYVTFFEILQEELDPEDTSLGKIFFVAAGFVLMALLDLIPEDHPGSASARDSHLWTTQSNSTTPLWEISSPS